MHTLLIVIACVTGHYAKQEVPYKYREDGHDRHIVEVVQVRQLLMHP